MPELAEVEFYRRRWAEAGAGRKIVEAWTSGKRPTFRPGAAREIVRGLPGRRLTGSAAAGKRMAFRFDGFWLGIHLGMTGELRVEPPGYTPRPHDHLVLRLPSATLVFADPRRFGRVEAASPPPDHAPGWWTRIPPPILSPSFTVPAVTAFLHRRARAPIKAVLLMQERFPGVGNWMADEILWRCGIHPARRAGTLTPAEVKSLWRECRRMCRLALRTVAGAGGPLPSDLNLNIPASWLFRHRWEPGGRCPKTGVPLKRATVGGRTTCWCPARQRL